MYEKKEVKISKIYSIDLFKLPFYVSLFFGNGEKLSIVNFLNKCKLSTGKNFFNFIKYLIFG